MYVQYMAFKKSECELCYPCVFIYVCMYVCMYVLYVYRNVCFESHRIAAMDDDVMRGRREHSIEYRIDFSSCMCALME